MEKPSLFEFTVHATAYRHYVVVPREVMRMLDGVDVPTVFGQVAFDPDAMAQYRVGEWHGTKGLLTMRAYENLRRYLEKQGHSVREQHEPQPGLEDEKWCTHNRFVFLNGR